VAFPTETVYGLGADAFNQTALARVFAAKGRPRFDPLIIHIAARETLDLLADLSTLSPLLREKAGGLAERLWPGPLTLIFPKRPCVPDLATGGLPTAAIRFPDHPVAQALIRLSTGAVAAPSANPFGRLSPTRAEHVRDQLGDKVDFIIDGGRTAVGVESTVLDLSGGHGNPRILRPGGVSREAIEALIGAVEISGVNEGGTHAASISPGQLKSHYAPCTPLSLHSRLAMAALPYTPGEIFLFFSPATRDPWLAKQNSRGVVLPPKSVRVLSPTGSSLPAAANLVDLLHELDRLGAGHIHVEEAPPGELGPAINDRLIRAAGKSDNKVEWYSHQLTTEELKKFIEESRTSRSDNHAWIGNVEAGTALRIKAISGVDISKIMIEGGAIRHSYNKAHHNLEDTDLLHAAELINKAKSIELSTQKHRGSDVLIFKGDINGEIIFLKAVRPKHGGWLSLVTCYRPKKAGRGSDAAKIAPRS
jgi:L-threonylcarbamoyladenylate synthase